MQLSLHLFSSLWLETITKEPRWTHVLQKHLHPASLDLTISPQKVYLQGTSEPHAELTNAEATGLEGESPPSVFKGSSWALTGKCVSTAEGPLPRPQLHGGSGTLRGHQQSMPCWGGGCCPPPRGHTLTENTRLIEGSLFHVRSESRLLSDL